MERGKKAWVARVDDELRSLFQDSIEKLVNQLMPYSSTRMKPELQFLVNSLYFCLSWRNRQTPGMRFFKYRSDFTEINLFSGLLYFSSVWALERLKYMSVLEGEYHS